MRFRLQYLDAATKQWVDLSTAARPGFVAVGAAKSARQAGRSFQLVAGTRQAGVHAARAS